jgi:hypothetical protein
MTTSTTTLELIDLHDVYGDNLAELFVDIQNESSGSIEYENDTIAYYILLSDGILYYDYAENITNGDKMLPYAYIYLPCNPSELLVVNTVVSAYNTLVAEKLPLVS